MGNYKDYKTRIIKCTQWLSENGYFGSLRGTGGNVSMRVEGEELFVITPSTLPYPQLSLDNMCVIDFDLNQIEGELKPSVEAGLHLECYKQRNDVNAVIHTHQIYASIFAVLNKPIPALFDEVSFEIGSIVDVVPYGLSGSPELIENLSGKLSNNCHCYLIQNHGAINLGATLDKAWLNVELLEKTARVYYGALSTGNDVTLLPDDIISLINELRRADAGK